MSDEERPTDDDFRLVLGYLTALLDGSEMACRYAATLNDTEYADLSLLLATLLLTEIAERHGLPSGDRDGMRAVLRDLGEEVAGWPMS